MPSRNQHYRRARVCHCLGADERPLCGQRGSQLVGISEQPANARDFYRQAARRYQDACERCMRKIEKVAP